VVSEDPTVTWLLFAVAALGLPLLSLLADLVLLDTRRAQAAAEVALRRVMESPDPMFDLERSRHRDQEGIGAG
jgi:hypothetical protein